MHSALSTCQVGEHASFAVLMLSAVPHRACYWCRWYSLRSSYENADALETDDSMRRAVFWLSHCSIQNLLCVKAKMNAQFCQLVFCWLIVYTGGYFDQLPRRGLDAQILGRGGVFARRQPTLPGRKEV